MEKTVAMVEEDEMVERYMGPVRDLPDRVEEEDIGAEPPMPGEEIGPDGMQPENIDEDGIMPYIEGEDEDDGLGDERDTTGVPVDEVLEHLQSRCQASALHVDFVRYIPFLIMFCFFFLAGRDIRSNYYVVRVIKDRMMGNEFGGEEVLKSYETIANADDLFTWQTTVGIPNLYMDCGADPLIGAEPPGKATFSNINGAPHVQIYAQGMNYLLGAVRFRTHRVKNTSCEANEHLFHEPEKQPCWSSWSTYNQDTDGRPRKGFPHPAMYPDQDIVFEDDEGYHVDWPVTQTQLSDIKFLGLGSKSNPNQFANEEISFVNVTIDSESGFPEDALDGDPNTEWVGELGDTLVVKFPEPTHVSQYTFVTGSGRNLRDPVNWRLEGRLNDVDNDTSWEFLDEVQSYNTPLRPQSSLIWFPQTGWLPQKRGALYWTEYRFSPLMPRGRQIRNTQDKPFLYQHSHCTDLQGNSLIAYIVGDIDQYHCGGYIVDIPFNLSCRVAENVVKAFGSVEYPFYDNYATRFTSVEYFVYSVQLNTFTSVKLFNEQAACGSWVNKWQIRTFLIWTDRQTSQTIFDFFFLAFVMFMWYRFFVDWRMTYKGLPPGNRLTKGKVFSFILPSIGGGAIWAIMELANLIVFVAVFGLRFAWWGVSASEAKLIRFPFDPYYPEELDKLLNLYMMQVYANAVNTVITFLKFLKYVRMNSRLNILTATISLKADNMVACLVIFVYILVAYALAGHWLFGATIQDYRSVDASLSTLMRMLLGDFDYVALRSQNRILAGVFFWSWIVIGLFLMLNFLIAILSEGFAMVSEQQTDVPLEEQMVRAWVQFKRAMRPSRIIEGIKMWTKGHSRASILERATCELEEKKDLMEEGDDGCAADDDPTKLIYRKELPAYIGRENYELLGADFVNDVWDDVIYSWKCQQLNSERQQEQDDIEMVEDAVGDAIKGHLDEVDHMDSKMRGLETELNSLLSLLQRFKTIPTR